MNLNKLTIGLSAIALIQISAPTISSSGKLSIGVEPAAASKQTNSLWKKYLGGRKVVQFSSYSSGYGGGGGMRSKKELHFCSNGQFAASSSSSVVIDVPGASASDNGSDSETGTWKIIESNQAVVKLEITPNGGAKIVTAIGLGQDGKLYNNTGTRLFTDSSDACS